jgi:hypothetical protein
MSRLENAATTMEKRLPAVLLPADRATAGWAGERAKGAATALRRLKRQIAAPVGNWERLIAVLHVEVVAVATGDLGKLRWERPPSPATVRRSRWQTGFLVLKTVVLSAAPLAVVIAAQPLLDLGAEPLRWAKIVGLAWAVLYLLLAVDPTLRDKIETAQSVGNLLSSTRRDPPDGGGRSS